MSALQASDGLKLKGSILVVRTAGSTLASAGAVADLDEYLENNDGRFVTPGMNFSMSAKNVRLEGTTVVARLYRNGGPWVDASFDLSTIFRWTAGVLEYCPYLDDSGNSSEEDGCEDELVPGCDACMALFGSGQFKLPEPDAPAKVIFESLQPNCHMCSFLESIAKHALPKQHRTEEIVMRSQNDQVQVDIIRRPARSQLEDGISVGDLPKTFQDAIRVCERLDIQYLWIDSLCILQDSKPDWQTESSRMASYYGNCYICIAATSSPNPGAGWRLQQRKPPVKFRGTGPDELPFKIVACPVEDIESVMEHPHFTEASPAELEAMYPLLTRAWAYQERQLAPRIVHLCQTELVFECAHGLFCECGNCTKQQRNWTKSVLSPTPISMTAETNHVQSDANILVTRSEHTWRMVICAFSALNLSHPADRLPALSGLAQASVIDSEYLAGIWSYEFEANLAWYVGPDLLPDSRFASADETNPKHSRPLQYVAPSWSWAAVLDRVRYDVDYAPAFHHSVAGQIDLVESNVYLDSDDPMGQVRHGSHLVLRGRLIECELATVNAASPGLPRLNMAGVQGSGILKGTTIVADKMPLNSCDWPNIHFLPDRKGDLDDCPRSLLLLPLMKVGVQLEDPSKVDYDSDSGDSSDSHDSTFQRFSKIQALVLRRVYDHQLALKTSLPILERIGYTVYITTRDDNQEPLAEIEDFAFI
ncbi:hypothetical protein PRZ48_009427 [Zasmidium cellare]|uniref:Heterokaryon incompatibility domain-containing protein n=1 Tax=Zasmidium cellare TaxID=395010 RepID=A0ABR0EBR2_ZASCE|nr:hypothetical protein PRZ48_009427 [Zasmidium cellare]